MAGEGAEEMLGPTGTTAPGAEPPQARISDTPASSDGRWAGGRWVDSTDPQTPPGEAFAPERGETDQEDLIPVFWEKLGYAALFFIALAMRLWDLGARAVHHDESLHGFFAWQIFNGTGHEHNPLLHGMFLFHSVAGSFWIFGDSDYTMRLPMALFGSALVLMPLLLRSRLGQVGALAAAVMLAFSPAMLYFSRFARNDIFMAVFVFGLFVMIWRYLDERKNRYLYLAAAFLALGFTTKETAYISSLIFMVGLLYLAHRKVGQWLWGRSTLRQFDPPGRLLILLACLTMPLGGAIIAIFQEPLGITLAATAGNAEGLPTGSPGGGGWAIAIAVTVALTLTAMGIGLMWNRRAWLISWAVFAAIFVTIFTNFFTHPGGIGSGIWQSLGYWMAQQEVNRGEQPWFYYFIMVSVYEFLPFLIAVGAAVWYTFKGNAFSRFLVFWTVANFAAYSLAGEKMPWLLVNVALPIIILAAKAINDMVRTISWRTVIESKLPYLLIGVPLFLILIWRLAFFQFDNQNGIRSFFALWLLVAAIGVILVLFWWLARRMGWKPTLSATALLLTGLMFLLTIRAGWVATYTHSDVPREMLVYTQTSPLLHDLVQEIEAAGNLTGDREDIRLYIDAADGYTWPWAWYLRNYAQVSFLDLSQAEPTKPGQGTSVAVVHAKNNDKVETDLMDEYTSGRRIPHRWWFPERYKQLTPGKFFSAFADRESWRVVIDFFLYRELAAPIGSVDSYVYFDKDIPLAVRE